MSGIKQFPERLPVSKTNLRGIKVIAADEERKIYDVADEVVSRGIKTHPKNKQAKLLKKYNRMIKPSVLRTEVCIEIQIELEKRGLYYILDTTKIEGRPAFHILHQGRCIAIEIRVMDVPLTRFQKQTLGHLLRTETPVLVANNKNEAIAFMELQFGQ